MLPDIIFWTAASFALAELTTSLLPFVPYPHGVFRVFEFPRTQSAIIAAFFLAVAAIFLPLNAATLTLMAMLGVALAIQLFHIARFTPFWRTRSERFDGSEDDVPVVGVLTSNVKQGNDDRETLPGVVRDTNADICVFMEVNEKWVEALDTLGADYPYTIRQPFENGYGMLLMSKMPFREQDVRFLLNEEVPSFDVQVAHPDGCTFRLVTVHPEPPVVHGDTIGRDAEISLVGEMVREDEGPVMVCGDLNDVAWSRTTRRFMRMSRLLDPREGRGQYNTFDARYFFLRWPLDHIFHSGHFKLIEIRRLPFVGSDHFPMFYKFALTATDSEHREIDEASKEDFEEADQLIEEESERERRPVGHDWEDG